MKWPTWLISVTGCIALVIFAAGCGDDESAPPTDEEVISELVTDGGEFGDYFDLSSFLGDIPSGPAPSRPAGLALAPIVDLDGWHREPGTITQSVTVSVDLDAEPDAAHVVAFADITGELFLRGTLEGAGNTQLFTKPLGDRAERHAAFVREGSRWVLEGVSHVNVTSQAPGVANTVRIDSVEIAVPGEEPLMIVDWHEHADLADMLTLPANEEVTIIVYTNGVPARAYLHTGGRHGAVKVRVPLSEELKGQNAVQGIWNTPALPGVYHAAVDLLEADTIGDSDAAVGPYDSNVWMLVYRVQGGTGGS